MPCNPGSYALIGSGVCSPCPEDAECSNPAELPRECQFGWHRRGEQPNCTPCPAGRMCKGWSGSSTRGGENVMCPLGAYTKAEYPGVCIPCPPGFQCPDPTAEPQPCPPGTGSLGGVRRCSSAPAGLVVLHGREHLPPRPCEEGLLPLEIGGRWLCGTAYEEENPTRQRKIAALRSSPATSIQPTAALSFRSGCPPTELSHSRCFGNQQPPKTWCPFYASNHIYEPFPDEYSAGPYAPRAGDYAEYFTAPCGYALTYDDTTEKVGFRDFRAALVPGKGYTFILGLAICTVMVILYCPQHVCALKIFGDAFLGSLRSKERLCRFGRYVVRRHSAAVSSRGFFYVAATARLRGRVGAQ